MTTASYTTPPRADRPAWRAAKTVGDAGEQLVADVLRSIGLMVEQHFGKHPHDLSIGGRVEVKTDRLASSSGNLAVEYEYAGQPSGISTSSATAWAFVVGAEVIFLRTADLLTLAGDIDIPRVRAGEDARVALVPIERARRLGRVIPIARARR